MTEKAPITTQINVVPQKRIGHSKIRRMFRENLQLTLLAIPGIILLFLFNYMPMFGIVIAFKKFNPNLGIWGSEWKGLENFKFFFTSQDAWRVTKNTVLYSLDFMIIGTLSAVVIALLLYNLKSRTCVKTYNTIMILPTFLSMVLIAFIVYAILNPVSGVLNQTIKLFGGEGKADWYALPNAWPLFLTIINLWQHVGYNSIIYYASLMGIDESLFEAARLDGANKWHETIYIAIPHLIPIMTIITILSFGSLFNGDFGLFYQTTRDVGLLYPTTDIINTYVFRGLMGGNMEVSAAVGLFQSLVGLIMVVVTNSIVKKVSPDNSLF